MSAYDLEGTAGTQCYDAGATNPELLAKSQRNAAKAHALFERALIRIQAITGTPVATTTTTDNASKVGYSDERGLDRHRRRVLWALPTGLYVIGSRHRDAVNLMTANLVVQVCLEPELVAVAIEATARTAELVSGGGAFSISLLARTDKAVVRKFVKAVTEVDRGDDGALVAMSGQPVHEVGEARLPVLVVGTGLCGGGGDRAAGAREPHPVHW